MKKRSTKILFISAALLAGGAAHAQDVGNGMRIAQMWCSNCHIVGTQEPKSGSDAVPSFISIARMNSTTEMSLEAFLSSPHAPMPDLTLSRTEIQDVSAYILSLRNLP